MDFKTMSKSGGQIYGDFDLLVSLEEDYMCIEVKTSPRAFRYERWTGEHSKGLLSV